MNGLSPYKGHWMERQEHSWQNRIQIYKLPLRASTISCFNKNIFFPIYHAEIHSPENVFVLKAN